MMKFYRIVMVHNYAGIYKHVFICMVDKQEHISLDAAVRLENTDHSNLPLSLTVSKIITT